MFEFVPYSDYRTAVEFNLRLGSCQVTFHRLENANFKKFNEFLHALRFVLVIYHLLELSTVSFTNEIVMAAFLSLVERGVQISCCRRFLESCIFFKIIHKDYDRNRKITELRLVFRNCKFYLHLLASMQILSIKRRVTRP